MTLNRGWTSDSLDVSHFTDAGTVTAYHVVHPEDFDPDCATCCPPMAEMACCIGDDIDECRRSQRRRAGLIGAACWLLMVVSLVGAGVVLGAIWGMTR
jgi:hypothetical protein